MQYCVTLHSTGVGNIYCCRNINWIIYVPTKLYREYSLELPVLLSYEDLQPKKYFCWNAVFSSQHLSPIWKRMQGEFVPDL